METLHSALSRHLWLFEGNCKAEWGGSWGTTSEVDLRVTLAVGPKRLSCAPHSICSEEGGCLSYIGGCGERLNP